MSYERFTDYDCDQVYCIDKAQGSCEGSGWHCCTCVCNRNGYPYADKQAKKCVAFPKTTTVATKIITTTGNRVKCPFAICIDLLV